MMNNPHIAIGTRFTDIMGGKCSYTKAEKIKPQFLLNKYI